jgi:hypothetical protein
MAKRGWDESVGRVLHDRPVPNGRTALGHPGRSLRNRKKNPQLRSVSMGQPLDDLVAAPFFPAARFLERRRWDERCQRHRATYRRIRLAINGWLATGFATGLDKRTSMA